MRRGHLPAGEQPIFSVAEPRIPQSQQCRKREHNFARAQESFRGKNGARHHDHVYPVMMWEKIRLLGAVVGPNTVATAVRHELSLPSAGFL